MSNPYEAFFPKSELPVPEDKKPIKICLKTFLSPGDILCLTLAVESLVRSFPDEYEIYVHTSADQIWLNNPNVSIIPYGKPIPDDIQVIECTYDTIHKCSSEPWRMLEGYTHDLGKALGLVLHPKVNKPYVYLTEEEQGWISLIHQHFTHKPTPYVLISAGHKRDYTCKCWPSYHWQSLIDMFLGKVAFVQIGHTTANNPKLERCYNAIGMTDHRQFLRLVGHKDCVGGVGGITYLGHACAAFSKPYVLINGGREPTSWVTGYQKQHTISTVGFIPCSGAGCWRSRVVPLGDGEKNDKSLCERPNLLGEFPAPECMAMISPQEVAFAIERWLR